MELSYRQPRELMAPDPRLVMDAAAILHLREFDLFRAAWRNWFGRIPDDKAMEPVFVDYLFHQRIPFWVRHFANRVISDAEAGEVNRCALGVTNYPTQEPLPDLEGAYLAMAYIAVLALYLLLTA